MGKSYIEREALKRVYMGKGKDKLRIATVINELELAPAADVVEVVRCKDCVEWEQKTFMPSDCRGLCRCHSDIFHGNYFCADGERRKT